jgi:hypothetical protein
MMVRLVALLGIVLLGQTPPPKSTAGDPLFSARHLACSFPVYAAPVWKDGAAQVVSRAQDFAFDIDAIDTRKNKTSARIVGKGGASAPASVMVTPIAVNVIEGTPIGNLNVTTVFVAGGSEGKYITVHSRHIGDLTSAPSPSQNYGTCTIVK